jgi:cytochrome b6-f complex iron-sulfur subunit
MADRESKSIQDILAACRAKDGSGPSGSEPSPPPAAKAAPPKAAAAETAAAESAAPAAKKPTQMSVQEMLAAARAEKAKKAGVEPAAASPPPADAATAPAKDPKKMSVAEMLAAARAEKSGVKVAEASGGAVPAKPAAEKPVAAQPAAAKPTAKAGGEAKALAPKPAGGALDTASILAAARGTAKPGPVSKAEAAARTEAPAPAPAAKTVTLPPRPEKPAYAMPRPAAAPAAAEDRRGFLATLAGVFVGSSLAVGFTTLALTNLLWVLGLARFMFPNILIEPPTKFKVGFPDNFAPGQVETKYIAQFGAWIVRAEYDGVPQIFALQSVCTHLGCTPNWLEGEQKFKCPCHGSGFYKDGVNFEGPAPRPLERYAIRVADDGQLEVDKSRRFKEEIGQWQDPASFVTV